MEFESQENMYPNLQSFQQEGKAMYQVEPQNAYMNNGGQLFTDQTTFYSNMTFGQNYVSQNNNNIPANYMNQQNFMSQQNYMSPPNFLNQNITEMNMNSMIGQQSFMNGQQGFIKTMNAPQPFLNNMNSTQNYVTNMNVPQNFGSNMNTPAQNFMTNANSFGNEYGNIQVKQTNQEEDGNDEEFKPEEVVDEESSEDDDEEYEPEEPIDINSDNNFNLEDYLRVRDQL